MSSNNPSFASLIGGPGRTFSQDVTSPRLQQTLGQTGDTWKIGDTTSTVWSMDESPRQEICILPLDADNRIAAYVDFSEFYEAVRKMGTEAAEAKLRRQSSDTVQNTPEDPQ